MSYRRPIWVTVAGIACWVIGIVVFLNAVVLGSVGRSTPPETVETMGRAYGFWHPLHLMLRYYYVLVGSYLCYGVWLIVAGRGLLAIRPWSRGVFEGVVWFTLILTLLFGSVFVWAEAAPAGSEPDQVILGPHFALSLSLVQAALLSLLILFMRRRSVRALFVDPHVSSGAT